jgi:hypothetical protein
MTFEEILDHAIRACSLVPNVPSTNMAGGARPPYTQMWLDPLPPVSAEAFVQALPGRRPPRCVPHPAADRTDRRESLLSGRDGAHAGRDRGVSRHAGSLLPGAGPPAGPGDAAPHPAIGPPRERGPRSSLGGLAPSVPPGAAVDLRMGQGDAYPGHRARLALLAGPRDDPARSERADS